MPVLRAIAAAALYGLSVPLSKVLLAGASPLMMSSMLYFGAGIGMLLIYLAGGIRRRRRNEAKLSREDIPFTLGMIALDITAPALLMTGLRLTSPASASLLSNFEIVATTLIALLIFKEAIGKRLWAAIALITAASVVLSIDGAGGLHLSLGSLLIILACSCWGLENNLTRMLSLKDPVQIVIVKGIGSGAGALLIAYASGSVTSNAAYNLGAFVLGFFSFGLSIYLYVSAQRDLGAARTSSYYAFAPFIGTGLSFLIFGSRATASYFIALAIMIMGSYLAVTERHDHMHCHGRIEHEHRHRHDDLHHDHPHDDPVPAEHSHPHVHEGRIHSHPHFPDLHHTHRH